MDHRDRIDSTIDNWLSSQSQTSIKKQKKINNSNRKSRKSTRTFNIESNFEPNMGLDDLPNKYSQVIEQSAPSYRWSSFADADSLGLGVDDGMSSDLRGFAGE